MTDNRLVYLPETNEDWQADLLDDIMSMLSEFVEGQHPRLVIEASVEATGSYDTSQTPFVDTSTPIPTIVRSNGRCYASSAVGRCTDMGLTFDTIEEWQDHRQTYHPFACSELRCDNIASYSLLDGPSAYCIEHMPDNADVAYAWVRANQESIIKPPRLSDSHPVEMALAGLEHDG